MRRGCGGTRRVRGYKFGFHSADSRSRGLGSSSDQAQASGATSRGVVYTCLSPPKYAHGMVTAITIYTQGGYIARGIDGINV